VSIDFSRRAELARQQAEARDARLDAHDRGPFATSTSTTTATSATTSTTTTGLSPEEAMRLAAQGQASVDPVTPPVAPPATPPVTAPVTVPAGPPTPLEQAADHEVELLRQQLAAANASGDREGARAINALLQNETKLTDYVSERAQIGVVYDGIFPEGGGPGVERDAFVNAAQVERDRLAEEVRTARDRGDMESLRALNALLDDPAEASDYLLDRTLLSLSYDAARANPASAEVIGDLSRQEYTAIVQRAQSDLADERLALETKIQGAADPAERDALTAQLTALETGGDAFIGIRLATASEADRLRNALAAGNLDPATAQQYQELLASPARLEERVTLGQMYDAELERAKAAGPDAEAAFVAQAGTRDAFMLKSIAPRSGSF
jgi:hypothetical protein